MYKGILSAMVLIYSISAFDPDKSKFTLDINRLETSIVFAAVGLVE
jgi:hypothetical protein